MPFLWWVLTGAAEKHIGERKRQNDGVQMVYYRGDQDISGKMRTSLREM